VKITITVNTFVSCVWRAIWLQSDIRKDLMVMLHYSISAVMQSGVRVRCCCCWRSTVLLWMLCSSAYCGCVGCIGISFCVHVVFGGWPLVEFVTEGPDLNPTVRYWCYMYVVCAIRRLCIHIKHIYTSSSVYLLNIFMPLNLYTY
jgi:hypothetical protein